MPGMTFFLRDHVSAFPTNSMWSFYHLLWRTPAHLDFRLFSEGNDPYVTVNLVCLWEVVSSGSSYAAILDSTPDTFKSDDQDSNLALKFFKFSI